MNHHKQFWRLLLLGAALAIRAGGVEGQVTTLTQVCAHPVEDKNIVLHNPDMGWVLYDNYPVDPRPNGSSTMLACPEAAFPEVDHVAIMFSWQDIERTVDHYDFSLADRAYDYWKKLGKRIHLRLSTEPLILQPQGGTRRGKGIPDYVFAHVPAARQQPFFWVDGKIRGGSTPTPGARPAYILVDARDAYYLERMEKFLRAVASHFRGLRAVELVDLRGYGQWGEWHSGYQYPSIAERRQALKGIIDCYARCFPENFLALSYSFDPAGPKALYEGPTGHYDPASTKHYWDYLEYSAFDYALGVPNVTFRRDGAGGAVHSNERKLNEDAYRLANKGPLMSEFVGGYRAASKGGRKYVDWTVADALSLHPNYVCLLGWQHKDGLSFYNERPDLIAHGLRIMGYRLFPATVEYPGTIAAGAPLPLEMEWLNRGVGKAARKFHLHVALMDEQGQAAATADAGSLETDRWLNNLAYRVSRKVILQGVKAGRYDLRIALIDPRTGKPLGLPIAENSKDGFYRAGPINLVSSGE